MAAGGGELERVGVRPDLQPPSSWPDTSPARPEDDCVLQLAQSLILRAKGPQPAALLLAGKALVDQMKWPLAPVRPI